MGGMQALASAVEMREGGRESGSVCEGVDFLRPTTDFFASVSKETRVKMNELEFAMLLQLNETGRLPHSVVFWELD